MLISEFDLFEIESMESGDSFISESGDFSVVHYGKSISLIENTNEISQIRHFFSLESLLGYLAQRIA